MKVAVVGSGVAGLAATWSLNEHSDHEVHLFEADNRPGGHANTVNFTRLDGKGPSATTPVDTGFIVFNTVTYPNFLRFIKHAELPYIATEMSFAVSRDRGLYEWAGTSLGALFAQKRNIINPAQWRMVWDILRFNSGALEVLADEDSRESIGNYLDRNGYSAAFRDNYLMPMTAAIWSTPPDQAALDFPALTLIRFMHNHHLLQILDRPTWLSLQSGSLKYVSRIVAKLDAQKYHASTRIQSASSTARGKVTLVTESGESLEFDHVIFATHADTTLKILERGEGITSDEREVLGGFEFSNNRAVLHSDPELMPKRRQTWSAWNYLTFTDGDKANVNKVSLTYWMNLLQNLSEKTYGHIFVTLNPPFEPRRELIAGEYWYTHPLFSEKSVKSQELLPSIQNKRGVSFCGAWSKYGFHEDGFKSGLEAAERLGGKVPFDIQHAERVVPRTPMDRSIEITLRTLEAIRRLAQRPWSWFALCFALVLLFAEWALYLPLLVVGRMMPGLEPRLKTFKGHIAGARDRFHASGEIQQLKMASPAQKKLQ